MRYVALLRGIVPTNPNMRNEKLRSTFETLGLEYIQTILSSGNVLFETETKDTKALEIAIEKGLQARLAFAATTILRSREQMQALVDQHPFQGMNDTPASRFNVTFLKHPPAEVTALPYPEEQAYKLLGLFDGAICTVIDTTSARTPQLMTWLEKQFGKDITTRTWKTVDKIFNKLNVSR